MKINICKVEACKNKTHGKGFCRRHYDQIRKKGKILDRTRFDPNEIILKESHAALEYNKYATKLHRNFANLNKV